MRRSHQFAAGSGDPPALGSQTTFIDWDKPECQISDVPLDVSQLLRIALDAVSGHFFDKIRATAIGIPVVVHKMMKTGFGDRPSDVVPMFILGSVESHREIKRAI
jgi:hypothetical protein